MQKQRMTYTGLLETSPKDLEKRLVQLEIEQEASVRYLTERLDQLDRAVAAQKGDIHRLEANLRKPETQNSFIELAERFLARLEYIMATPGQGNRQREQMFSNGKDSKRTQQENELRQQIVRCRRRIDALTRAFHQQGIPTPGREGDQEPVRLKIVDGTRRDEKETRLRLQYIVNKTAGEDIVGPRGELILRKGETVSMESAEKVYRQGMMEQLVRCMGE